MKILPENECITVCENFELQNGKEALTRQEIIDYVTAIRCYSSAQLVEIVPNRNVEIFTQHEKDLTK
jgi:hypothetical protein